MRFQNEHLRTWCIIYSIYAYKTNIERWAICFNLYGCIVSCLHGPVYKTKWHCHFPQWEEERTVFTFQAMALSGETEIHFTTWTEHGTLREQPWVICVQVPAKCYLDRNRKWGFLWELVNVSKQCWTYCLTKDQLSGKFCDSRQVNQIFACFWVNKKNL